MQLSFYHESSPVKTPFHVHMLRSDTPIRQIESGVEHAASFPSRPPCREPHIQNRMLLTTNPIQTIPATEILKPVPVSQKQWGPVYLQKCRGSFATDFSILARFMLTSYRSTLAIRRPLLAFLHDFLQQPILVRPGVNPTNRLILALLACCGCAFPVRRNRCRARKDFGAHSLQISLDCFK